MNLKLNTKELLEGKKMDYNELTSTVLNCLVKIVKISRFKKEGKPEKIIVEFEVQDGEYKHYVRPMFYDIETDRFLFVIRNLFIACGLFEVRKDEEGIDRSYVMEEADFGDLIDKNLYVDFIWDGNYMNTRNMRNIESFNRIKDEIESKKSPDYKIEENPFNESVETQFGG